MVYSIDVNQFFSRGFWASPSLLKIISLLLIFSFVYYLGFYFYTRRFLLTRVSPA